MSGFRDTVVDMMSLRTPKRVNEEQAQKAREKGAKADALLRDEAMQDAFKQLDETYTRIWRNTSGDDIDVRERAWTHLKVLDDLRNHLLTVVRDGAVAQRELEKALRQ